MGEQSSLHVAGRYTKVNGDINAQGLAGLADDGRTAVRYQYHEVRVPGTNIRTTRFCGPAFELAVSTIGWSPESKRD